MGMRQERTASPSRMTMQLPQCPLAHPSLVPVSRSTSRITSISQVLGEAMTSTGSAFTEKAYRSVMTWLLFGLTSAGSCFRSNAGHQQAQLLRRGRLALDLAHDAALIDHHDSVGQSQDLVQVFRNQERGGAGVTLVEQAQVHVFGGPDVEAARRLGGDEDVG